MEHILNRIVIREVKVAIGWIIFIVVIIVGVFINNAVLLSKIKVSDELLEQIKAKRQKEQEETENKKPN